MCERVCSLRVIYCRWKRASDVHSCAKIFDLLLRPPSARSEEEDRETERIWWWSQFQIIYNTRSTSIEVRERERRILLSSLSIISSSIAAAFNCMSFFLSSWSSPGNDTVASSPLSLCVMTDRPTGRLSACDWAERKNFSFLPPLSLPVAPSCVL